MTDQLKRLQQLEQENAQLRSKLADERTDQPLSKSSDNFTQARYRTVFENSLLGNKIISADLKILDVNMTLVHLLGFETKEQLTGHEILEFAHPDFKADWRRLQKNLWDKQVPSFNLETCLVRNDGKSIWVHITSILFKDDEAYLGYTIIEDISRRRAGFEQLRLSEQHFKTITDIMPQQVWTADTHGQVNFVNKQVRDYFRQGDGQLFGDEWKSYVHPEDAAGVIDAWHAALGSGKPFSYEYRIKDFKGNYRWHLSRAVSVTDDEGVRLWLGTNTDIDEQKNKERQKDEFLSIASHELKTPLTSIKLFNQLAAKITDPAKKDDFIDRSATHVLRLERLINDLLDVTKINAGKMNYEIAGFDYNNMLQEAVMIVQASAEKHDILLELDNEVTLLGDRHRIEQVVNNLLINAIKYSPEGNQIVVKTQLINDSVITSVQDFGIGIEPEEINKLFNRYYRVDNTAKRFDGLGLGLYISAEILKRHNGSLWIESEPGKGSTFYFILPLNGQTLLTDLETDNQTYYKGNFINIKYNEEQGWLEADWIGYQNLESVKKGCMIILDLLKKNATSQVLNDNTLVQGNWSEASDWGAEFWFPAMADAGLRQFAWIYSPSMFSRLAAEKSLEDTEGIFENRFFGNKADAIAWLQSKR